MSTQRIGANKWVIFGIRKQEFALPVTCVREILAMPDITTLPLHRPEDRGVLNLRGRVIPLIDLRKRFGWHSVPEELDAFYTMMSQREQDHHNWLTALERSVLEDIEFGLATDPHKCAFGQWYYAYRSDSPWISALLRNFEEPHSKIHALAATVSELIKAHQKDEACRLMDAARSSELHQMTSLFHELKRLTEESVKELAMVITTPGRTFAISIDQALAVEHISPDLIKELRMGANAEGCVFARRVAQRKATGTLAIVLEPEMFDLCNVRPEGQG